MSAPELPPEAASLRDAARTERTPLPDGTMVWRIWGEGPPVLLLHGGFGSWMHWLHNIRVLAQRHTVIVPDLPGAGDSGGDPASMAEIAAIVADGLGRIGVSGGYDIVGFSFGTSVALHLPEAHRARVRRLMLMGSAAIGPFVPVRTLTKWREIADPAARAQIHAANLRAMMLAREEAIDESAVAIHMHNVEAWRLRLRKVSPTGNSAARLAEWRPDCLDVVWGREDVIVRTEFEELVAIIREAAPSARFHFIDDAGHWVQFEGAVAVNELLGGL